MQEKFKYTITEKDITDNFILSQCNNFREAIKLCIECSNKTVDEITTEIKKRTGMQIQNSNFSDAMHGRNNRNFWNELIEALEEICSNWIPTRYLVLKKNLELKPKKEVLELENEQLKVEIEKKDREYKAIIKFLKDSGYKK